MVSCHMSGKGALLTQLPAQTSVILAELISKRLNSGDARGGLGQLLDRSEQFAQ